MDIKPIGNRVLIKSIKVEEKSFSGIILSTSTHSIPTTGIITALGNITENINLGDKVFFKPNSGIAVPDTKKKQLILDVEDILAVIKTKKKNS